MEPLALLLVFLGSIGCMRQESKPVVDSTRLTVTLQRTECFGLCPMYSVTVSSDRNVRFHGERWIQFDGDRIAQISEDAYQQLLQAVRDARFDTLKPRYRGSSDGCGEYWTDHPSMIIMISSEKKTYQTNFNMGCKGGSAAEATARITLLGKQIDTILDTGRWIGPPENRRDPSPIPEH